MELHPLIPREPKEKWLGISYSEYLEIRYKSHPAKDVLESLSPELLSAETDSRIQYLFDTKSVLNNCLQEIINLVDLIVKETEIQTTKNITSYLLNYVNPTISLLGEAQFEPNVTSELMSKVESAINQKIDEFIKTELDFNLLIKSIINYYNYKFTWLKYLNIGLRYNELSRIKALYISKINDFEAIKSSSPLLYSEFVNIFKKLYSSTTSDYRIKFKDLYLALGLQQIVVAKNAGDFTNYGQLLQEYYAEKLSDKKLANWLYKNFTGYGENPWRLFYLFITVNVIFSILFTFSCFEFKNINPLPNQATWSAWVIRFITFLSFNNTTMLTVGYGDIYPVGVGAKLMVIFLQLLGFVISSSAVALFLRKIFRF